MYGFTSVKCPTGETAYFLADDVILVQGDGTSTLIYLKEDIKIISSEPCEKVLEEFGINKPHPTRRNL